MLSFIKTFFQGILYILLSPILLIVLAFNLIYGIFIYFFYELKAFFLFFRGVSYKSEDEETRTLREIKNKLSAQQMSSQAPINNINTVNQTNVNNKNDSEVNENV